MKTITFSAIKGGVGKSSLCILVANFLAALGLRVLVIDMDIQNSTTFYYSPEEELTDKNNIFRALSDDDLKGNIIKTEIDIIPSSFNLIKIRAISEKTLSKITGQVSDDYDYCLIDTAPTFDNIVLNAVIASDLIITPVFFSQFDWKSACFFRDQIDLETDKISNWKVLLNKYKKPRTDNPDTELNQYNQVYNEEFKDSLLDTKIPDTSYVKKSIDTKTVISKSKTKIKLYNAISSLCSEIKEIKTQQKRF